MQSNAYEPPDLYNAFSDNLQPFFAQEPQDSNNTEPFSYTDHGGFQVPQTSKAETGELSLIAANYMQGFKDAVAFMSQLHVSAPTAQSIDHVDASPLALGMAPLLSTKPPTVTIVPQASVHPTMSLMTDFDQAHIPMDQYQPYHQHTFLASTRDETASGSSDLIEASEPVRPTCHICNAQFTRSSDRNRHITWQHKKTRQLCKIVGCTHSRPRGKWVGFCRPEKLRNHIRAKHANVRV